MNRIADAGPLVALINQRDRHHKWAKNVFMALDEPLWTCEAVLAEAAHLTKQPGRITEMVSDGLVRIGIRLDEETKAIAKLLNQYSPRMDLADACVVRMSELIEDPQVLTFDRRDFSIYRRNGNEVIPIFAPPVR